MRVADYLQRQAVTQLGNARDVFDELVVANRFVTELVTENLLRGWNRLIVNDVGGEHIRIGVSRIDLRGRYTSHKQQSGPDHRNKPRPHSRISLFVSLFRLRSVAHCGELLLRR